MTKGKIKSIKHYTILERIGSGGMGEVFKANDTLLERNVAIKLMHKHLSQDKQNVNRLLREARAAAKLVHPNVVTIHEIGEADFGHYIVMEYVRGVPLSDFIYNNESLEPERCLQLTLQILKAMQVAHREGVLHRDIKSENIFIDENDQIKVLDFGIAKVKTHGTMTSEGEVMGTIDYMAPEQMLGEELDARCDLYAVGIVLYHLLTCELPFKGENAVQVLFNKLNEEAIQPSKYQTKIEKTLNEIVLKALNHDRDERWLSAEDFINALEEHQLELNSKKKTIHLETINYDLDVDEDGEKEQTLLKHVFIGRQCEFNKMVKTFGQIKNKKGQSILLKGEAGIGKSSLASKFRSYAEYNNAWVMYGACLYQEGMDPYLPFIESIRDYFSRDKNRMTENERAELKNLIRKKVPELSVFTDRFTTTIVSKEDMEKKGVIQSKTNLLESFVELYSIISDFHPLVIILDDLQWADAASLRLFHFLAKKIGKKPVMLMGIARTDRFDLQENGKPTLWVDIQVRMNREDLLEKIDLDYLSRENTDQLIDKSLMNTAFTEEFYEEIYKTTRGNPFFVLETLKTLKSNQRIILQDDRWIDTHIDFKMEVPDRVEDIFIRRLGYLSDKERELLQIGAVIGYKFDPAILSAIAEMKRIEVLRFLENMEKSYELVHGTDTHYQFEHPLLGDLLYNELPKVLAKEYHLMIADHLEKVHNNKYGSLVGDVAQHFRKGGNHQKAIPLLYQAGIRSFDISAYRESGMYFEDLVDSLDQADAEVPEEVSEIELYFKLGISYEETGNWQKSLDTYTTLSKISLQKRDYTKYANSIMRVGRVYDKLGDWQHALEYYESALKLADKYNVDDVKSRVFNNIGINYFQQGDFDSALEYFQETLKIANSDMAEYDKAHAYTNIGIIANILHGAGSVALKNFENALEIYKKKDSKRNMARVYQNMGMIYSDKSEWDNAIDAFENCLTIANETEEKQLKAITYLNLGKTYARQGTLLKAKNFSDKALKMFKRMNDILGIAEAYHIFGIIYCQEEDFKKAEKFLNESIKINKEKKYKEGQAETLVTYAQLLAENGFMDQAQENYMKAANIYQAMNVDVKVKEIQSIMDEIRILANSGMTHTKLLMKKYGKTVSHS